jgi:hypothetical protein
MKIFAIGTTFFICSLMLMPLCAFSATTRIVPDAYATVQAGIDAAVNGDTVLVRD